jgi:hypothetical protein
MEILRDAVLQARMWGWDGNVPAEQLADLMDAVHNIPGVVQHWEACEDEHLKMALESYERKWGKSGGSDLRTHYEQLLKSQSKDE